MDRGTLLQRIAGKIALGSTPAPHPVFGDLGLCFEWIGCRKQPEGYAILVRRENGKQRYYRVHRLVYALIYGDPDELQAGLAVCHKCNNTACIRPSHLALGTTRMNIQDAALQGRMRAGALKRSAGEVQSRAVPGEQGRAKKEKKRFTCLHCGKSFVGNVRYFESQKAIYCELCVWTRGDEA